MKVLIIGGTGLLGSQAATELISRGHEVTALALPPVPPGAQLPPAMKLELGDYLNLDDQQIYRLFDGCKGFVFAAGVDERVEGPPPIYEMFERFNITPLRRLLRIAKECGVERVAVCGSYFSYFAGQWPELRLDYWHPYIRSRVDQAEMALSFADENFSVGVLELPYIFGAQPGRKPVWVFLVEMIRSMKGVTLFPKGGTTMVTVRQVGEAIAGALERTTGGQKWPIGWHNKSWKEFLTIVHKHMDLPRRKIITIPKWMFSAFGKRLRKKEIRQGLEGGLNLAKFADLQCSEQFIDKSAGCLPLGVRDDDIDAAIGESIRLSLKILEGSMTDIVDMKA